MKYHREIFYRCLCDERKVDISWNARNSSNFEEIKRIYAHISNENCRIIKSNSNIYTPSEWNRHEFLSHITIKTGIRHAQCSCMISLYFHWVGFGFFFLPQNANYSYRNPSFFVLQYVHKFIVRIWLITKWLTILIDGKEENFIDCVEFWMLNADNSDEKASLKC